MRKLAVDVEKLIASWERDGSFSRKEMRAAMVNKKWEYAVRAVFKDAAQFVLDHINAVYVVSGEQGATLRRFDRSRSEAQDAVAGVTGKVVAVYSDDSMVRSELDNRQELLKMKMHEQGEQVEALRIIPSTRDMKGRRPFALENEKSRQQNASANRPSVPLSDEEFAEVSKRVSSVEDPLIRRALLRAMVANEETKKGQREQS